MDIVNTTKVAMNRAFAAAQNWAKENNGYYENLAVDWLKTNNRIQKFDPANPPRT